MKHTMLTRPVPLSLTVVWQEEDDENMSLEEDVCEEDDKSLSMGMPMQPQEEDNEEQKDEENDEQL